MSIFDKLKKPAPAPAAPAAQPMAARQTFTFAALPESLAQMQAMPEAALRDPFQTAALTVCALCAYAADKTVGTEMLNWLRGPRPLSPFPQRPVPGGIPCDLLLLCRRGAGK